MTFKNCTEYFPIFDTLVGSYSSDQSFMVLPDSAIDNIEKWRDNPFWEDSSCYSFVIFNPDTKQFTVWTYSFQRVSGYINETYDPEEFYPATYSEDFRWEKVDPWNLQFEDKIITPDDELAMEMGWPLDEIKENKWRREQVAYLFDPEAYQNGYIFTSPKTLKEFVKERKDLL